jgi:hypothetical protein
MAQMVECLPSKHESLNSNPSTAPPPKKTDKQIKSLASSALLMAS